MTMRSEFHSTLHRNFMDGHKYLEIYNALSAVLWGCVLIRLAILVPLVGTEFTCEGVAPFLSGVQSLALLEIVHSAVGLVRSSPVTALMQVASRLFLVWGVVRLFPQSAAHPIFSVMVAAWCLSELTRYPYYWAQLRNSTPRWLEWLRYSLFIILYPVGASSEAFLAYRALPAANYYHPYWAAIMKLVLVIYPPAFYLLYKHMFVMRKKVLGKHLKAELRKEQ